MNIRQPDRSNAFSLVELSIVLVILGLLTGGILSGQALIRASEIRSHIADLQRYNAAIYSFRDKYFAWPGDMGNATRFWGTAAGTGSDAACYAALSASSNAVCNGNGDGWIESSGLPASGNERYYAWKHLANAGLVEGSYSGIVNTSPSNVPGLNIPRSKITGLITQFVALPTAMSGSIYYFDGGYGFNTIFYFFNGSNGVFKPEEAWNIDTKLDDGKPATGNIFTAKATSTYSLGCATTDVVATAEYALSTTTAVCNQWQAIR